MFEFIHDCEELEAWFYERWLRLQAGLGRDLNHIQLNNHKHKVAARAGRTSVPWSRTHSTHTHQSLSCFHMWVRLCVWIHRGQVLEAELQAQESQYQRVLSRGQDLMSKAYEANQHAVQKWMRTLRKQWSQLTEQALAKRNKLHAATSIKQVDDCGRGRGHGASIILLQRVKPAALPRLSAVLCGRGGGRLLAERQEAPAAQRRPRQGRVQHGGPAAAPPLVGEGDGGLRLGDPQAVGAGQERGAADRADCECRPPAVQLFTSSPALLAPNSQTGSCALVKFYKYGSHFVTNCPGSAATDDYHTTD